jgi:glycosyltransferase involved in cell wall biosynthesis
MTAAGVRVLHLFGQPPDFQTERSAAALRQGLGPEFDVTSQSIGPGGQFRNPPLAVLGLRGAVSRYEVIHAWDGTALAVAALSESARVLYTPMRPLGRRGIGWLRAVLGYRDVHVVCASATQRRRCVERGVPLERCHLVRPGVEFGRVRRRRDPALRQALGIGEADHVLLAPGESTPEADHERAVWAGSILGVLDRKYKVLLWGRGPRARRAALLGTRLGQADLVRVAEERLGRAVEFEELLPAADTVLVAAHGPVATLPIAICMAAALPIVATVTYTTAELLEDRHTAAMVPPGPPRFLARRFLELQEDPALQWSIADMARTEAYEYFSLTRFINQYRTVYRQVAAGERVEVPEQAPGAGLRFHGRG